MNKKILASLFAVGLAAGYVCSSVDVQGKQIPVQVVKHEKNIAIIPPADLGVTVTNFDYGYWTKTKDGKTIHKPITEVPGAVKSTHAIKYDVHYWNAQAKPFVDKNAFIQIVPSVNPLTLRKGDTYEIQVFKDGKPYANAPLIKDLVNDLTGEAKADENGKATVAVTADGLNVVGVEVAFPTQNKGEQNKYFSALSFLISPEE